MWRRDLNQIYQSVEFYINLLLSKKEKKKKETSHVNSNQFFSELTNKFTKKFILWLSSVINLR